MNWCAAEKIPYTEYSQFETQFNGWKSAAGERNTRRKNQTGNKKIVYLYWEKLLAQIEPENSKCNPEAKVSNIF